MRLNCLLRWLRPPLASARRASRSSLHRCFQVCGLEGCRASTSLVLLAARAQHGQARPCARPSMAAHRQRPSGLHYIHIPAGNRAISQLPGRQSCSLGLRKGAPGVRRAVWANMGSDAQGKRWCDRFICRSSIANGPKAMPAGTRCQFLLTVSLKADGRTWSADGLQCGRSSELSTIIGCCSKRISTLECDCTRTTRLKWQGLACDLCEQRSQASYHISAFDSSGANTKACPPAQSELQMQPTGTPMKLHIAY